MPLPAERILTASDVQTAALRSLEIDVARLQQRVTDISEGTANLSLTLSLVAIGFGALITAIIVFFAFRTEKAAVAAAKDELRVSRSEIERWLKEAEASSTKARELLAEVEAHRSKAETNSDLIQKDAATLAEIVKKVSSDTDERNTTLSRDEKERLEVAANSIDATAPDERTPEDFDILIAEAKNRKDYSRVMELCETFAANFPDEPSLPDVRADLAWSLAKLNRADDAIREANSFIKEYKDNPSVIRAYCRVLYNRAIDQKTVKDFDGALESYGELIELLLAKPTSPIRQRYGSRALCNRANMYIERDRYEDALADLEKLFEIPGIDKKSSLHEPSIRGRLTYFRLAKSTGDYEVAAIRLRELIALYSSEDAPGLKEIVAKAPAYLEEAEENMKAKSALATPKRAKARQSKTKRAPKQS